MYSRADVGLMGVWSFQTNDMVMDRPLNKWYGATFYTKEITALFDFIYVYLGDFGQKMMPSEIFLVASYLYKYTILNFKNKPNTLDDHIPVKIQFPDNIG